MTAPNSFSRGASIHSLRFPNLTPHSVDTSPAGAAHVADFGTQTGNSLTWTVNATVGTSLPSDPFRRALTVP
jgi:hypothetical protein